MKKFLVILLSLSLLLPLPALAADQADLLQKMEALSKELDRLKQQMQEIQQKETAKEERITVVEKKAEEAAGPSWLEIGGDLRVRLDSLKGKVHDYAMPTSLVAVPPTSLGVQGYDVKNDSLLTNRFGLNLNAKATEDIQVKARLLMYKVWGHSTGDPVIGGYTGGAFFADRQSIFDGNVSHVPQDNTLRVDQAYATWSNIGGAPVWFSIGRRPSTGGVPSNLRQNLEKVGTAGVPALLVDYAFDGLTLGYAPDIDALPGAYAKLCYGKGFDSGFRNINRANNINDVNMLGINLVPYDTDNLHVEFQYQRAMSVFAFPDAYSTAMLTALGVTSTNNVNLGDIDYYGTVITGKIDNVGPGDLNLFASAAINKTRPNDSMFAGAYGLLYTSTAAGGEGKKSRTGSAYYLGARYDIKSSGTKIGAEYNHGSKNWIAFDPASDDMWTGKLGTRGDVYEVYLIQELNKKPIAKRGKAFFRLGYQYYKFDHTGSSNWVGEPVKMSDLSVNDATPTKMYKWQLMSPLKNASDIYLTFDVLF